MAKKTTLVDGEQGSTKPTSPRVKGKGKKHMAPPQKTDVWLRATDNAKFHEPGEEFQATRVIADKLISTNQAEEIEAPEDEE